MKPCPACGRSAELSAITSALTGEEGESCITCALANAETLAAVYAASSSDERWQSIPSGIRRKATVFESGEYVPIHQWAKRALSSALVVATPPPDPEGLTPEEQIEVDAMLQDLMRNLDRTARHVEERRKAPKPKPSLLSTIISFLLPSAWSNAHA